MQHFLANLSYCLWELNKFGKLFEYCNQLFQKANNVEKLKRRSLVKNLKNTELSIASLQSLKDLFFFFFFFKIADWLSKALFFFLIFNQRTSF